MITSHRYCPSCGAAQPSGAAVCFACGRSLKITSPLSLSASLTPTHHLLHQRYNILAQVGTGGYSAVYKAEDTLENNRLVAVKAVHLHGLKPHEVIEATETFNREVLLLASLSHPNLPHVYENFSDNESWYMVMDFIEGITLEKHLEDRLNAQHEQLPIGEVLSLGLLLCYVLDYLHTRQPPIIFRDLKPANVMLTPDRRIALIDFGIARHFKPGQARDTIPFGSPGYAAPEQYGKAQTTPRTDIYSLGVLLHQLLTGDDPSLSPFRFAPLPLQSQPELAGLETLIMQMVDMDASNRPENVTVVKQELQRMADAWSLQQTRGMRAKGPYSANPPSAAFFQALLPPPEVTGVPLANGGKGQMSRLQYTAPGKGHASSLLYWSTPLQPKKHNIAAMLSLFFGIVSIPSVFLAMVALMSSHPLVDSPAQLIPLLIIPTLLTIPSILAIIFGRIGRHRANTVYGLGESKELAIIGSILGYLFLATYLLLVASLFCHFFY